MCYTIVYKSSLVKCFVVQVPKCKHTQKIQFLDILKGTILNKIENLPLHNWTWLIFFPIKIVQTFHFGQFLMSEIYPIWNFGHSHFGYTWISDIFKRSTYFFLHLSLCTNYLNASSSRLFILIDWKLKMIRSMFYQTAFLLKENYLTSVFSS